MVKGPSLTTWLRREASFDCGRVAQSSRNMASVSLASALGALGSTASAEQSGQIRGVTCAVRRVALQDGRGAIPRPLDRRADRSPYRWTQDNRQARCQRNGQGLGRGGRDLGALQRGYNGIEVVVVPDPADQQWVGLLDTCDGANQQERGRNAEDYHPAHSTS